MAIAEIHGKTPYGYSEDILTADVFTAFRYLPADKGIIGFLRSIPGLDARIPPPDEMSSCEIFFWPLGGLCGREPDLLLELTIQDQVLHVVVEAKYTSGPSDTDDYEEDLAGELVTLGNQLADEFRDLGHGVYGVERGLKGQRRLYLRSAPQDRFLLYLTAHFIEPTGDLEQAQGYLADIADKLFWTSWYQVYDFLTAARETLAQFPYSKIIDDTSSLLSKKQFTSFQGIAAPPVIDFGQISGSFWRLVATPPEIDLSGTTGSFWITS